MVHTPTEYIVNKITALEYAGQAVPVIHSELDTISPGGQKPIQITISKIIEKYNISLGPDLLMVPWYIMIRSKPVLDTIDVRIDYLRPALSYKVTIPNPQPIDIIHNDLRPINSLLFTLNAQTDITVQTKYLVEVAVTIIPTPVFDRFIQQYITEIISEGDLNRESPILRRGPLRGMTY